MDFLPAGAVRDAAAEQSRFAFRLDAARPAENSWNAALHCRAGGGHAGSCRKGSRCGRDRASCQTLRKSAFDGFGVDVDAEDLREFFFDAVFESGGDVVDLGDRERAFHGAVTGSEDAVFDLADAHVMAVD